MRDLHAKFSMTTTVDLFMRKVWVFQFYQIYEFVNLVSEEPHSVALCGKCMRAVGITIIFANQLLHLGVRPRYPLHPRALPENHPQLLP
jgi:hypothetical protein